MDEAFTIPGTRIRVGLDSIIGLIPGIGDSVGLATTGYILVHGYRYGVRRRVLARMAGNAGVDFLLGSIPLVGDIFDVYFKANRRNADLLEKELARMGRL